MRLKYVRVAVATWNVGSANPAGLSLAPLLSGLPAPDVIVIGLQETQLHACSLLLENPQLADDWVREIQKACLTLGIYETIAIECLVGLQVIVSVRRPLAAHVADVDIATVATGPFGAGNKGCAAVRFRLGEVSLCFVCVHLTAHDNNVAQRNADIRYIDESLRFPRVPEAVMHSHDYGVVFGDLNYRLDATYEDAHAAIQSGAIHGLIAKDQLSKALGSVLPGYREGAITFNPTYKYDAGTDCYDKSSKRRTPAWPDRILVKGENFSITNYGAVDRLKQSDHRPVRAVVEIKLINSIDDINNDKAMVVARRAPGRLTTFGQSAALLIGSITAVFIAYWWELLHWFT